MGKGNNELTMEDKIGLVVDSETGKRVHHGSSGKAIAATGVL